MQPIRRKELPVPPTVTRTTSRPAREELEFERFVALSMPRFRRHLANRLRGAAELEDALQAGLMRMWSQWDGWPADPLMRQAYALRALAHAADDVA
jgi:DNA-directed RNA polymerase specialized sigma24 family protein